PRSQGGRYGRAPPPAMMAAREAGGGLGRACAGGPDAAPDVARIEAEHVADGLEAERQRAIAARDPIPRLANVAARDEAARQALYEDRHRVLEDRDHQAMLP